ENRGPRFAEVQYEILDASNRVVFTPFDPGDDPNTPPTTLPAGTYTLRAQNSNAEFTQDYSFRLSDTFANASPIAVGDTVTGTLPGGVALDFFTFPASPGRIVYLDGTGSGQSGVFVRIVGPDAQLVSAAHTSLDSP